MTVEVVGGCVAVWSPVSTVEGSDLHSFRKSHHPLPIKPSRSFRIFKWSSHLNFIEFGEKQRTRRNRKRRRRIRRTLKKSLFSCFPFVLYVSRFEVSFNFVLQLLQLDLWAAFNWIGRISVRLICSPMSSPSIPVRNFLGILIWFADVVWKWGFDDTDDFRYCR